MVGSLKREKEDDAVCVMALDICPKVPFGTVSQTTRALPSHACRRSCSIVAIQMRFFVGRLHVRMDP